MEWNNVIIQGENERERERNGSHNNLYNTIKERKNKNKKTQNIQFWVRAQSRG